MKERARQRILLSWSSGKDSAWTLHVLRQRSDIEVVGLFCTVNKEFGRVAMHAVREELLHRQALHLELPVQTIEIPHPCSNEEYEARMGIFVEHAKAQGISSFAFGDLFLEDIRQYREQKLAGTGITPLFPLWGMPTQELAFTMVHSGLRARITCINPHSLPSDWVGREYDQSFLRELPAGVDPCGENGEFHSFAFDGPMFSQPVPVCPGEVMHRDGFVFADLLLEEPLSSRSCP